MKRVPEATLALPEVPLPMSFAPKKSAPTIALPLVSEEVGVPSDAMVASDRADSSAEPDTSISSLPFSSHSVTYSGDRREVDALMSLVKPCAPLEDAPEYEGITPSLKTRVRGVDEEPGYPVVAVLSSVVSPSDSSGKASASCIESEDRAGFLRSENLEKGRSVPSANEVGRALHGWGVLVWESLRRDLYAGRTLVGEWKQALRRRRVGVIQRSWPSPRAQATTLRPWNPANADLHLPLRYRSPGPYGWDEDDLGMAPGTGADDLIPS